MLLKESRLSFLLLDNRQGKTNRLALHNSVKPINSWQIVICGFVDYQLSLTRQTIIRLRLARYERLKMTALCLFNEPQIHVAKELRFILVITKIASL